MSDWTTEWERETWEANAQKNNDKKWMKNAFFSNFIMIKGSPQRFFYIYLNCRWVGVKGPKLFSDIFSVSSESAHSTGAFRDPIHKLITGRPLVK